jgi:hypothetical protein
MVTLLLPLDALDRQHAGRREESVLPESGASASTQTRLKSMFVIAHGRILFSHLEKNMRNNCPLKQKRNDKYSINYVGSTGNKQMGLF